jgi:OmpA-OmpF porin, OOP family
MKSLIRGAMCGVFVLCGSYSQGQDAPDAEGCKDSNLVNRYPRSNIDSCENLDYQETEFPISSKDGTLVTKPLQGEYHESVYMAPSNVSAVQLTRNFQAALKAAGFVIDFVSPPDELVGHKGNTWIYVESRNGSYEQKIITVQGVSQEIKVDGTALHNEISQSGHVAVYGVHFDTGKATLQPDSEAALDAIVNLLQLDASLRLKVEGHTDNQGLAPANLALSQRRAEAVVVWLTAHGIDRNRLSASGRGQTQPVADNGTEEGRAKNRRVELVKI